MTVKGKFGRINTRKENLDYIYPRVQEKLIEFVREDLKNKTIKDIVKEVKRGKHGDDEYRKEILGDLYNIVQNKVNESMGNDERYELNERNIEILAERVIEGEFGDEEQQKKNSEIIMKKSRKKFVKLKALIKI